MELSPLSKGKFAVKFMEGYSIEFTSNENSEVTGFVLTTPAGEAKGTKKK